MTNNHYESRKRWNATNYKQINIAVPPDLSAAFRSACEQNGISMREVLVGFIAAYAATPHAPVKHKGQNIDRRSQRRKAIQNIVGRLMEIRDAEEQYKDNIPENLRNSARYEAAEHAIETLEEVIGLLDDAF